MKFTSDIDIDCADRDQLLRVIDATPASIRTDYEAKRHNTGVHVTDIPRDYQLDICALDHEVAVNRGYVKLDLLNVNLYKLVRDETHLIELTREPDWTLINDRTIMEKMIHINRHYDTMCRMPEPINSIPRMAMFLAVIRPGKRHLIGKPWSEVAKTIWDMSDDGYMFKKAHAIAYAHVVVMNMNLYEENPDNFQDLT
jgi:hypothetical protein